MTRSRSAVLAIVAAILFGTVGAMACADIPTMITLNACSTVDSVIISANGDTIHVYQTDSRCN